MTHMLYMLSHVILANALQYGVSLLQLQKLRIGEVEELAQGAKPAGQVVKSFFLDTFLSLMWTPSLSLTEPGSLWMPASSCWRKQVSLQVLRGNVLHVLSLLSVLCSGHSGGVSTHPQHPLSAREGTGPGDLPITPTFLLLVRPEVQGHVMQGPGADSTWLSHPRPQP